MKTTTLMKFPNFFFLQHCFFLAMSPVLLLPFPVYGLSRCTPSLSEILKISSDQKWIKAKKNNLQNFKDSNYTRSVSKSLPIFILQDQNPRATICIIESPLCHFSVQSSHFFLFFFFMWTEHFWTSNSTDVQLNTKQNLKLNFREQRSPSRKNVLDSGIKKGFSEFIHPGCDKLKRLITDLWYILSVPD